MEDDMKVTKKYEGFMSNGVATLKIKDVNEMYAWDFWQMCLDLYEKEQWFNDVSIIVHTPNGDKLLSFKGPNHDNQ
jgi:hypothetical protein